MNCPAATGLRGVFRQHRGIALLTIALLAVTLLAGTGLLALAGHFLTAAALAGSAVVGFNFFGPSAGIRALTFIRILSRYGEKLAGHDATLRIARDLRSWFFRSALPLAPLGLGRYRVGDLLARLVADIETVDGLLVRALGPLLALAILSLLGVAIAWWVLPAVGALLALALLLMALAIPLAAMAGARAAERERADARASLRYGVQEAIEGAADLQALQATARWMERIDLQSQALAQCERRRKRRLALGQGLHATIAALALPALLWLLLQAVHRQQLEAPAAGGLLFLSVALFEAMAAVGLAWQSLQAALASARRLREVAAQPPLVRDPANPVAVPAHGELRFQQVSFRWPGEAAARRVLDGMDLTLAPGQRIAIHGDSGTGKSSALALALRLCDPDAGRVLFDGIDLRDVSQADWHARIAWLPQEAPVFAGRVRDNLLIGAPDADDARLWQVLAQVRLEERFRGSAEGLDTWVGESGATLSAGQARRLALARALLRDAPILLLDEPTEGLDEDTAHALLIDLAAACGERSVLMISHDTLPPGVVHQRYRLQDGVLQAEDTGA
ncbi:thiol reductant ABC exporter subunit CydC [Pseudoxanthomonas wuyuanensis]|uniref:ATP-binding cassette, subfamily C, CydC n=1 Tax=Pseudoxanthomonas wuyuanensis TaxID=1073196 RepID=A0A286DGJ5_9GAMM|nr:thiol reductant ABC exporter subunit CydC [Pseudoxanthomonas wuyuanensis]KAF1717223.1 thiol reductant ABC exporter subunit CydC [Pseudoxanthomonas wuyuanensis]SOD57867.1 ATP-binding cassette, subfamily C, CydC [Pseudoxanthomonas wuyuanensis]